MIYYIIDSCVLRHYHFLQQLQPPKEKEDDFDPNADIDGGSVTALTPQHGQLSRRKKTPEDEAAEAQKKAEEEERHLQWRRILLLVIAITVHNIPGKF